MLRHLFAGTKWDQPCERCARPLSQCECPAPETPAPAGPGSTRQPPTPPGKQQAIVRVEKRPGGKKVTVVMGLAGPDLEELLPRLKTLCGAGGTIKDDRLEVQGDQRERVAGELASRGYRAKLGN